MASIFDGPVSYFGLDRNESETFGRPPTPQEMADRMVADHSAQGRNVNVTVNPDPEALGGPFVYSGPDSFKAAVGDIGQDLYGAYNSVPGRITRAASSLFSPASAASYLTGQVAEGVYDSATKGKVTPGEFGPLGNPVSRYTPEEIASGTRNYMGVGEFGPPANNRPAPSANNRPAYLSDMYDPHAGLGPTATVNYPTADAFISALGKDVVSPAYTALTNSLINPAQNFVVDNVVGPAQNFVVDNVVGPAQNVVDNVVGPLTSGLGSLFTGFQTAADDVVSYIADALGISKNDVTQEHVDQVNASQTANQWGDSYMGGAPGQWGFDQELANPGGGPLSSYPDILDSYPARTYNSITDYLGNILNVQEPEVQEPEVQEPEVTQAQIDRITSRPDLPDEPDYSPAFNLAGDFDAMQQQQANKVTPGPLSTTESGGYLVDQARAREGNNLAGDFDAMQQQANENDDEGYEEDNDYSSYFADGGMVNRDGFSVDPTTGRMTIDPTTAIAGWMSDPSIPSNPLGGRGTVPGGVSTDGEYFDRQDFLRDAYIKNAPGGVAGSLGNNYFIEVTQNENDEGELSNTYELVNRNSETVGEPMPRPPGSPTLGEPMPTLTPEITPPFVNKIEGGLKGRRTDGTEDRPMPAYGSEFWDNYFSTPRPLIATPREQIPDYYNLGYAGEPFEYEGRELWSEDYPGAARPAVMPMQGPGYHYAYDETGGRREVPLSAFPGATTYDSRVPSRFTAPPVLFNLGGGVGSLSSSYLRRR